MNRQTDVAETAAAVRDAYPGLPWARIAECDRALNWELWHGPLPADYWTHAEPLDVYRWEGWERACDDLRAMLDPLPAELWVDLDSGCVTALDPDDDPYNWAALCGECGEFSQLPDWESDGGERCPLCGSDDQTETVWAGSESWATFDPRRAVLHPESFAHTF